MPHVLTTSNVPRQEAANGHIPGHDGTADKVRVGVIGCGHIAEAHLPAILRQPHIEAVSLADTDHSRARDVAARFGIAEAYPSLEAMLEGYPPDVVHILTPPTTHAALAIRAMRCGCHALVEKPMATSEPEARAMIQAADDADVRLCVNHNFVLDRLVRSAAGLIERGALGRLIHADAHFGFDLGRRNGMAEAIVAGEHWACALRGGPIADWLAHPASVLVHLLGSPRAVHAIWQCHGSLGEAIPDELRLLLETPSATGMISVSPRVRPDGFTVDLYGTDRSLHLNLSNMTMVSRRPGRGPRPLRRLVDGLSCGAQMLTGACASAAQVAMGRLCPPGDVGTLIDAFYAALRSGEPMPVSGRDGLATARLQDRACEALETYHPAPIPLAPAPGGPAGGRATAEIFQEQHA